MFRAPWCVVFPLGALVSGTGCASGVEDPPASAPDPGGLVLEDGVDAVGGALTVEDGGGRARFAGRLVGDGLTEVEIELEPRGVLLSFLIDRGRGVVEADAYLVDTGADVLLEPEERALLRQLAAELDLLGREVRPELALVRDLASHWSEFPGETDMQLGIALPADEPAASASTCAYLGSYVRGTHDGWWESNWSDRTTVDGAYLSMHAACRGVASEDTQSTWWRVDGSWRCLSNEPNHSTSIEYAYGDCLGRCGSGCGAGTVFAWSCLDHDICNRFGHSWSASLPGGHCADEFTAAAAELLASPECL